MSTLQLKHKGCKCDEETVDEGRGRVGGKPLLPLRLHHQADQETSEVTWLCIVLCKATSCRLASRESGREF
jgi:hypothetical protein